MDAAASGAITAWAIALNGCYDPTLSISGQQPLYFDQHATLYKNYCVVAWRLRIDAVSTDNTNSTIIGFCPTTESSTLTAATYYAENKANVYRVCTPDQDRVVFGAAGGVRKWLKPTGGKLLTDPLCCAAVDANPSTLLYGHLYAQALDNTSDPATINYMFKLEQIVIFFEPKIPARS